MQLVNLIADGKDKLHLDFVYKGHNRLGKYLTLIRSAVLDGMEDSGSDPLVAAV
jgi:nuclear pore complex protein Nup107